MAKIMYFDWIHAKAAGQLEFDMYPRAQHLLIPLRTREVYVFGRCNIKRMVYKTPHKKTN